MEEFSTVNGTLTILLAHTLTARFTVSHRTNDHIDNI